MKIIANILLVIALVDATTLECEFKFDYIHNWGDRYTCRTKKFVVKDGERKLKAVDGLHLKNQTSDTITQYFARNLNIERFPSGLGDFFTRLEVIRITACNMRLLFKGDLENLGHLKYLDLVSNKIEKLESNTFENVPTLVEVILNNNRLQFIGSKLLDPLKKLHLVSFGGNVCTTSHATFSEEQLARLKTDINLKCSDISRADIVERFERLEAKLEIIVKAIDEMSLLKAAKKLQ